MVEPILFTQLYNDSIAREQLLSVLSGFFAPAGIAAKRHRHLWPGGVECGAAHHGDRGADGAGRYPHEGVLACNASAGRAVGRQCHAALKSVLPHFRCKAVTENLTSSIR